MRMISIRAILIASFVIGFAITGVSAQQMPLGPGSGYPEFVGMAPPPPGGSYPGSMCAPPPPPVKCRPPVPPPCAPAPNMGCPPLPCFNPYACPPPMCAPPPTAEPAVYVGYLFKDHGAGVEIQFNNGDVATITSTRNDFDLQGVWLELALPFVLSENVECLYHGSPSFSCSNQGPSIVSASERRCKAGMESRHPVVGTERRSGVSFLSIGFCVGRFSVVLICSEF